MNYDENKEIKNIILDMLPKNNKKFIIFIIAIIGFSLNLFSTIFIFFFGGIYGGESIFKKFDITGFGEIIIDILIILFIILLVVTCVKTFGYSTNGVDYKFNKIIAIVFIIFSIIPIISFFSIRNLEEQMALEYKDKISKEYYAKNSKKKNKQLKNLNLEDIEIYLKMKDAKDLKDKRKVEILEEIDSGDFYYKIFDSFWYYDRWYGSLGTQKFYLNDNNFTDDEIVYYCVFFDFSLISVIISIFFAFNCIEPTKRTKDI